MGRSSFFIRQEMLKHVIGEQNSVGTGHRQCMREDKWQIPNFEEVRGGRSHSAIGSIGQ